MPRSFSQSLPVYQKQCSHNPRLISKTAMIELSTSSRSSQLSRSFLSLSLLLLFAALSCSRSRRRDDEQEIGGFPDSDVLNQEVEVEQGYHGVLDNRRRRQDHQVRVSHMNEEQRSTCLEDQGGEGIIRSLCFFVQD